MARLDMHEYRENYLMRIQEHLLNHHENIPHFTRQLLYDAIRQELNRADPETWLIDLPDDYDEALCEAEKRIIDTISKSHDYGPGHGGVVLS